MLRQVGVLAVRKAKRRTSKVCKSIAWILISVSLFTSCRWQNDSKKMKNSTVSIIDESTGEGLTVSIENPESRAVLVVKNEHGVLLSNWEVGFPVTKIDVGDADGDGNVNLLVVTPKPTRKYPEQYLPRPFIFSLGNGHLYPRWLGSTFGYPLIDFRVMAPGQIRVWMQSDSLNYLVARYSMNAFSPIFEETLYEGYSYIKAKAFFVKGY